MCLNSFWTTLELYGPACDTHNTVTVDWTFEVGDILFFGVVGLPEKLGHLSSRRAESSLSLSVFVNQPITAWMGKSFVDNKKK